MMPYRFAGYAESREGLVWLARLLLDATEGDEALRHWVYGSGKHGSVHIEEIDEEADFHDP